MFGHQDNQPLAQSDQGSSSDNTQQAPSQSEGSYLGSPGGDNGQSSPPPPTAGQPWQNDTSPDTGFAAPRKDAISPAGGYPKAPNGNEQYSAPAPAMSIHTRTPSLSDDNQLKDATNEDLIEVKQRALEELFPLIDKLDQSPEEHFRTMMMIIQASDNQTLIQKAYQIAQTIDNEKVRAQALLDIVNEINYFTQQPEI